MLLRVVSVLIGVACHIRLSSSLSVFLPAFLSSLVGRQCTLDKLYKVSREDSSLGDRGNEIGDMGQSPHGQKVGGNVPMPPHRCQFLKQ